jgi:tripartite-type tricarboxylate transporter receptor subunit TctC
MLSRRATLAMPALLLPATGQAQAWRPTQQIRIVVPAAPGGTTDIAARMFAQHLQTGWGATAVVENRSGGGGTIGTMEIVRAPADGHHILSGNIGPQAIGYSLFRNLQYRPESLLPLAGVIRGPNVLVLHPGVPAGNVRELVAYLKANPGKVSVGNPGVGQSPHLSAVWFNQLAGTDTIHVPFRGAAPAMVELVAGNIQMMFDNLTTAMPMVRAGRVKALAVTSAERSPQLPELPALRETLPELASYDVSTWFGLFLPAGTPAAAVNALNLAVKEMVEPPTMQARFAEMGGVSAWDTPAGFAAFVQAEIVKWRGVIQREGLQIDVS